MEKPVIERVELAISAIQNLMPDFKQLENIISRQMVELQNTETNHIFMHFSGQIAKVEKPCSDALTQLEYLLTLNRTLGQLGNLRVCTK